MPIQIPADERRYFVGQVTANGVTQVTIPVRSLTAKSVVVSISLNTIGGTPSAAPYVSLKTAAAASGQFGTLGIKCGSGDTSIYDVYVAV